MKIAAARFVVANGASLATAPPSRNSWRERSYRESIDTEIYAPPLNEASMCGTASFQSSMEDQFALERRAVIRHPRPKCRSPILIRDEIVPLERLPLRYVCHSPCFRREAGTYGKDTRGMIRQHQFDKVELVQIVRPEDSYETLEQLTGHAEAILEETRAAPQGCDAMHRGQGLRRQRPTTSAWLPGQNAYREISSCSNFESFQARRMQARYRNEKGKPRTRAHAEPYSAQVGHAHRRDRTSSRLTARLRCPRRHDRMGAI